MKFKAPDDASRGDGGNWLKVKGTFHLVVISVDEAPTKRNSPEVIDGFKVVCQAVEGTARDEKDQFTEKDKQVDLMFFDPKPTQKNEGEFNRKKQMRYLIATGLATPQQLGQEFEVDLKKSVGRQLIATLDFSDEEKRFLDLNFSDIWHIDDPEAKTFPRNEDMLKLVPKEHRADPAIFAIDGGNGKPTEGRNGHSISAPVDVSDL